MTALAYQIRQDPVILPELKVFDLDGHNLGPAQTAADRHAENLVPHFAKLQTGQLRDECSALFGRKPVSNPDSKPLGSFQPANACRQVRAKQSDAS